VRQINLPEHRIALPHRGQASEHQADENQQRHKPQKSRRRATAFAITAIRTASQLTVALQVSRCTLIKDVKI
jgi:hypothetical protein